MKFLHYVPSPETDLWGHLWDEGREELSFVRSEGGRADWALQVPLRRDATIDECAEAIARLEERAEEILRKRWQHWEKRRAAPVVLRDRRCMTNAILNATK